MKRLMLAVEEVAERRVWKADPEWFIADRWAAAGKAEHLDIAVLCGWVEVASERDLLAPAPNAHRATVTRSGAAEYRRWKR